MVGVRYAVSLRKTGFASPPYATRYRASLCCALLSLRLVYALRAISMVFVSMGVAYVLAIAYV